MKPPLPRNLSQRELLPRRLRPSSFEVRYIPPSIVKSVQGLLQHAAGHELGNRAMPDQPRDEPLPGVPTAEVPVKPEAAVPGTEDVARSDRVSHRVDTQSQSPPNEWSAFCMTVMGCSSTSRAPAARYALRSPANSNPRCGSQNAM